MVYYGGYLFTNPSQLSPETQRAIRDEAARMYFHGTKCPKCGKEDNKDHVHKQRLPATASSTAVAAEWECWSCGYKWPCYPVRA